MLQFIRNLVTGWFAVAFVAILIIPFAFFGINYYFDTAGDVNAVQVNDSEVTLIEYQQVYQNVRQQWQQIDPSRAGQDEFIKQQTIDTLIDRLLLLELREELGLRVTDQMLRDTIAGIQAFRNPEGFDIVAYQNYLLSAGYTPAGFEQQVRQDITMDQLQSGILQSMFVTRPEIIRMALLLNQTRDIEYAVIPRTRADRNIEVTDGEIEAYYERQSRDFMQPEQVRIAYILLSIEDIAAEHTVDESSVRQYFEEFKDRYSVTERRKIRQLLVYQEDEITEEAATVAKEINELLREGLTFEEVVEQYDEAGTVKLEISDFGYLNKGVLDPQVDETAFSLEENVISEPVRTEFGYHFLVVEGITGGTVPSFSEVRDKVEEDIRRERAERDFFELYDELALLTYEHPETLEVAAESLGLEVHESDFFSRNQVEDPLLDHPAVLSAAFSEEVLQAGNNSDLIELDQDRVLVFRVIDHKLPQLRPLSDVREEIYRELYAEKLSAKLEELGREIIRQLEQGTVYQDPAVETPLEWISAEGISRNATDLDERIVQDAFSQAGPDGENSFSADGVMLENGDYAIVRVNRIREPEETELTSETVAPVVEMLSQTMIPGTWARILEDMRNRAKIRVYEENL